MHLGGIDTNLVVALGALLRERNVTRAAKAIGIGQSSMSHALARLRAHFGDALLVQVGRAMVPTERGKALAEPAWQALAKLEQVFSSEKAFEPAKSTRTFHLAATDSLGLCLLPRLARTLAREAPGVALRVHPLPPDWALALLRGDLDLKLGRKQRLPAGLTSQALFEERFACVVGKKHPAARGRLSLRGYAGLRHLAVAPSPEQGAPPGGLVDAVLARHGLRRRVVLTVPHFLVAPFVAASSDLALTASERLLAPFLGPLGLRRLELPVKLEACRLAQVWAERSHDDQGHLWLRGAIARLAAIDGVDGSQGNPP